MSGNESSDYSLSGSNYGLNTTDNGLYEDLKGQQKSLQSRVKSVRSWFAELANKEDDEDDFELQLEFNEYNGTRSEVVIEEHGLTDVGRGCCQTWMRRQRGKRKR